MENLFQIINDDYGVFVNLNLKNKEILSLEHNMLTRNTIDGLVKITYKVFDEKLSYNYDITSKLSLNTFLEKEISSKDILIIFKNIIDIVENSKKYLIGINQILFDCKHIYIDITTLNVFMICIPIKIDRVESNVDFKSFFKDVLSMTQLKKDIYSKDIIDILNILNSSEKYSLLALYDRIINILATDKSKSVFIENDNISNSIKKAIKSVDKNQTKNVEKLDENDESNIKKINKIEKSEEIIEVIDKEKIQARRDKISNKEIELPIQKNLENKKDKKSKRFIPFSISDILKINKNDEVSENMNLIVCEDDGYNENEEESFVECVEKTINSENISKGLIKKQNDNEVGETICINKINICNPYLVSNTSGEIFSIDSNPCRIGKEKKFADILIRENETVSRAHAQIINELGKYYIVDNNSKNHTYINDIQVNSEEKNQINHNDSICFSNEKYTFKEY